MNGSQTDKLIEHTLKPSKNYVTVHLMSCMLIMDNAVFFNKTNRCTKAIRWTTQSLVNWDDSVSIGKHGAFAEPAAAFNNTLYQPTLSVTHYTVHTPTHTQKCDHPSTLIILSVNEWRLKMVDLLYGNTVWQHCISCVRQSPNFYLFHQDGW